MNKNTIQGLGQKEAELVARLSYEKKKIVRAEELDKFLPGNFKYRKQFVYNLKQKGILTPFKRGVYVFTPLDSIPSGIRVNELLIPPIFFPRKNYYIGYSTMFNYYGFIEQLFQVVYVINTSLCQERDISGITYKFVKVSEDRLYGLDRIKIEGTEVLISSKERTLVDLIYFNKPVGGIVPATQIFKRIAGGKECNVKKLVEYAAKFPNVTTRKRIGLILENMGVKKPVLRSLIKSVEKTAISSLNGSRKGPINKTWRVISNASRK